jgi:fermentation-respiration switch protein FrsA (DUF1100 family)
VQRLIHSALNVLTATVVVALFILVALLVLLWKYQERIAFQPSGPPYPGGGSTRRIDFDGADGQPLFAYLVDGPAKSAQRGLVIAFHGNADLAAWQIPWATELARRSGYAVLLPEFRGYGGLPGTPGYTAVKSDARAVYVLARDTLGFSAERVVIFGHSLGSAIAAELAYEVRPAALVLQAPLTSAREMARQISLPSVLLFWAGLTRLRYDTEALVRSLDVPVWVAHGSRDDVVPVRMGERVFAAAARKGEFLRIEEGGHNDLEDRGGERYWRWLVGAMSSAGPGAAGPGQFGEQD